MLELLLAAQVQDTAVDKIRPALDDAVATATQCHGNCIARGAGFGYVLY